MEYEMRLRSAPFATMRSGKKRVELRLYDEKRQCLRVGDHLCFVEIESGALLKTKIVRLDRFADFFELYRQFDKEEIGYASNEVADAADMYAYYSKEEIARYGVLAITVERV